MKNANFLLPKIKYLRQIIDEKGRWPDPSRANAIKNMPAIINVLSLKSFLGLANYHSNYIANMHTLRTSKKRRKVEVVDRFSKGVR